MLISELLLEFPKLPLAMGTHSLESSRRFLSFVSTQQDHTSQAPSQSDLAIVAALKPESVNGREGCHFQTWFIEHLMGDHLSALPFLWLDANAGEDGENSAEGERA